VAAKTDGKGHYADSNHLCGLLKKACSKLRCLWALLYLHELLFKLRAYWCWQLGLPEKNFFNDNFDLVLSEPSDANTTSTTLLSDETDDRPKETTNREAGTSSQREYEVLDSLVTNEFIAFRLLLVASRFLFMFFSCH
jgi:hypothetical protein